MARRYGSLLGTKLLLAGHNVTLTCREATANLINTKGTIVRIPIRGRDAPIELKSKDLSGTLMATTPDTINDVSSYDLVVLAMQEPQYSAPGVRELVKRIATFKIPTMSITNMPLFTFLKRIPNIHVDHTLEECFTEPTLWDDFDPRLVTQCSPDPQAFRPPEEPANVLVVRLPTNFKACTFGNDKDTAMLRQLEEDIQNARFHENGQDLQVPVKLRVYDSVFMSTGKVGHAHGWKLSLYLTIST